MPDRAHIRNLGRFGESAAIRYLAERGCVTVSRNQVSESGEVDLVVRDGSAYVAVEVKTTSDGSDPIDAVDDRKFDLVQRTAGGLDWPISRVDIVAVRVDRVGIEFRWLRGPD